MFLKYTNVRRCSLERLLLISHFVNVNKVICYDVFEEHEMSEMTHKSFPLPVRFENDCKQFDKPFVREI